MALAHVKFQEGTCPNNFAGIDSTTEWRIIWSCEDTVAAPVGVKSRLISKQASNTAQQHEDSIHKEAGK